MWIQCNRVVRLCVCVCASVRCIAQCIVFFLFVDRAISLSLCNCRCSLHGGKLQIEFVFCHCAPRNNYFVCAYRYIFSLWPLFLSPYFFFYFSYTAHCHCLSLALDVIFGALCAHTQFAFKIYSIFKKQKKKKIA